MAWRPEGQEGAAMVVSGKVFPESEINNGGEKGSGQCVRRKRKAAGVEIQYGPHRGGLKTKEE